MDSLCRLCGTSSSQLKSVFSFVESGRLLSDLIFIVCPIRIEVNDDLPKKVCEECLELVVSSIRLRESSVKSDLSFRRRKHQRIIGENYAVEIKEELSDFFAEDDGIFYENPLESDHKVVKSSRKKRKRSRKSFHGKENSNTAASRDNHERESSVENEIAGSSCSQLNKSKEKRSKLKRKAYEGSMILTDDALIQKIVANINEILGSTTTKEKATSGNVSVTFNDDGTIFTGKVLCPLCKKDCSISFVRGKHLNMFNFKRHFNSTHLMKTFESKIDATQRKITDNFKKQCETTANLSDDPHHDLKCEDQNSDTLADSN